MLKYQLALLGPSLRVSCRILPGRSLQRLHFTVLKSKVVLYFTLPPRFLNSIIASSLQTNLMSHDKFFTVCMHQSSSLLLHDQEVVTTAFQKFPLLFVFCFVDPPADAMVLQFPCENRACKHFQLRKYPCENRAWKLFPVV